MKYQDDVAPKFLTVRNGPDCSLFELATVLTQISSQSFSTDNDMDLVLEYCDKYFFNAAYSAIPLTSTWKEDHIGRQALSLFLITYAFALVFYFSMATASFHFLYDKSQMKHPKFLKDQVMF